MSCWRRTTVLRIPASSLGFQYRRQWNEFLEEHEEDFNWEPGCFAEAMCGNFVEWFPGQSDLTGDPDQRLDAPDPLHPESIPGPFLDYYLEEIEPLPPEENSYHENDVARPLTQEEKERYLPVWRELFPDFTLQRMENVHYCSYEWYDGAEAAYCY